MAGDSVQQQVTLDETPSASEENDTVVVYPSESVGELPVLPTPDPGAPAKEETLRLLRRFHLGGPAEAGDLELPGDSLPALLSPFKDVSKIRYAYPLFLYPEGDGEREKLSTPFATFLKDALDESAPGPGQARVLRDNLARVEKFVRDALDTSKASTDANKLLAKATRALQGELKLDDANRDNLQGDLDKLLAIVPPGARLLGYGEHATVHLFLHAARHRITSRRRAFTFQVNQIVRQIRALLEVERHKTPEASNPEAVGLSVGEAGSRFIDPQAFAKTMGVRSGSESLAPERRERVERSLEILEDFLKDEKIPIAILVHDGSFSPHWLEGQTDYELQETADPCLAATSLFDHKAAELSEVFRAVRVAELELSQSYDAQLHDPWFSAFDWETFSQEELFLLPTVVALDTADHVAGKGLLAFSRLLRSGRPVQILVGVAAGQNPGAEPGEDPLASYRFELGYVGMSHRESFISQSSIARPDHLLEGFIQALDTLRSGVHLLNTSSITGEDEPTLAPWLQSGAAIESRAHPAFRYNPEAGDSWANCVDFSENPEPAEDWPTHPLRYKDGGPEGEEQTVSVAFTYVDFALLCPTLKEHFRVVPDTLEIEDLLPLEAYLELAPSEGLKRLPFVWGVHEGTLRRLVVSRELVLSCQDRLNYWRTLQAVAGTRDEYAIAAADRAREEALAEAAEERKKLEAAHQEELEKAREETAGEAMQRLTEVLMGLDLTKVAVSSAAATPTTTTPATTPTDAPPEEGPSEPAAVETEEEEEEVSFDEPYIDSMLCTSCNDCMKFNPLTFVYNENKQALIGDAKAATFEQLVLAAEKCPARCIHPGKPLHPDEPNLDELIERAKPFN